MSQTGPNIDVLLICYNHEKYIQSAVESIIQQDYKGNIRVVVADDCSTDATVDIIRKVAAQQDRIEFEFLPREPNLGVTRNYERAFSTCKAEYAAVLEGDDIWGSAKKLTKQVAFLEEHRGCVACSCNYYVWDEQSSDYRLRVQRTDAYFILTSRILIQDNLIGNFSTCTYRSVALRRLPKALFNHTSYDWITNICIAQQGPIGFLNEPLSFYRIHSEGTWNALSADRKKQEQFDIIPVYNEITKGVFRKEFEALRGQLSLELSTIGGSEPSPMAGPKKRSRTKALIAGLCPPLLLPLGRRIYRSLMLDKSKVWTEIRREPT